MERTNGEWVSVILAFSLIFLWHPYPIYKNKGPNAIKKYQSHQNINSNEFSENNISLNNHWYLLHINLRQFSNLFFLGLHMKRFLSFRVVSFRINKSLCFFKSRIEKSMHILMMEVLFNVFLIFIYYICAVSACAYVQLVHLARTMQLFVCLMMRINEYSQLSMISGQTWLSSGKRNRSTSQENVPEILKRFLTKIYKTARQFSYFDPIKKKLEKIHRSYKLLHLTS